MKLDSLHEYLLLSGLVSDGTLPELPKLFLYEAKGSDPEAGDIYALLTIGPAGLDEDEELPGYHKGMLQVVTTSVDFDSGYDLALKLSKRLKVYGLDLEDVYIYRCVPRQLPINYREDDAGKREFLVNFDITVLIK